MRKGLRDEPADRLFRAKVAGQSGLVTRAQALRGGYSTAAITWQLSSRRWVQVHRGVYLTTPGRDDREMRAVAALLAIGAPCALRDASAGAAWGLTSVTGPDVRVLVPFGRRGVDRPGISVVRSRHFHERVHPEAWPHRTTAEHTVFDLAMGHDLDRAVALMAKACQLRIATEESLALALATRPTQTHHRKVAEMLGLVGEGAESAAEVRYPPRRRAGPRAASWPEPAAGTRGTVPGPRLRRLPAHRRDRRAAGAQRLGRSPPGRPAGPQGRDHGPAHRARHLARRRGQPVRLRRGPGPDLPVPGLGRDTGPVRADLQRPAPRRLILP